MTINYRFATESDFAALYEFALHAIESAVIPAFAQDVGHGMQDRMEEGIATNVIIAEDEDEDRIVAYAEIDKDIYSRKSIVYIMGIFVLEEYRRQGIGGKILKMIQDEFCKAGEPLRSRAFTKEGVKFWRSLNFDVHHYNMELKR